MTANSPTPVVDLLAERFRVAFDKTVQAHKRSQTARAEWIEGTLELGEVVLQARNQYPDHREFSRWLGRNNLHPITPAERVALLGFARDPVAARRMLQTSTASSWRGVWEKAPKAEKAKQRTLSTGGKGTPAPISRRTGHAHRQRVKQRIPTVMQAPRPIIPLKPLTREEVDPNFQGTPLEFATKYGHVNLHTKTEIEHDKQQAALTAWQGEVSSLVRAATALSYPQDLAVVRAWLEKPGKRAKFDGWVYALIAVVDRLKTLLPPKTSDEIEAETDAAGKAVAVTQHRRNIMQPSPELLHDALHSNLENAVRDTIEGTISRFWFNIGPVEGAERIVKNVMMALATLPGSHWMPDPE